VTSSAEQHRVSKESEIGDGGKRRLTAAVERNVIGRTDDLRLRTSVRPHGVCLYVLEERG
jgi:hypothetical protein